MAVAAPPARKLGIGEGDRVGLIGPPAGFVSLLEPLPTGAAPVISPRSPCRVLVVFARRRVELVSRFARAAGLLPSDGGLWVAYPKRSSGVATDLGFDGVQRMGLDAGLVDNKSCAIDATWTALRFVVRLTDRGAWVPTAVGTSR